MVRVHWISSCFQAPQVLPAWGLLRLCCSGGRACPTWGWGGVGSPVSFRFRPCVSSLGRPFLTILPAEAPLKQVTFYHFGLFIPFIVLSTLNKCFIDLFTPGVLGGGN